MTLVAVSGGVTLLVVVATIMLLRRAYSTRVVGMVLIGVGLAVWGMAVGLNGVAP